MGTLLSDAQVVETTLSFDPDNHVYASYFSSLSSAIKSSNYPLFLSTCSSIFQVASGPANLSILSCINSFLSHSVTSPELVDALKSTVETITAHFSSQPHVDATLLTRFLLLFPRLSSTVELPPSYFSFLVQIAFLDSTVYNSVRITARDLLLHTTTCFTNSVLLNSVLNCFNNIDSNTFFNNLEICAFYFHFSSLISDFSLLSESNSRTLLHYIGTFMLHSSSNSIAHRIISIRCFSLMSNLLSFSINILPISTIVFINDVILPSAKGQNDFLIVKVFELLLHLSKDAYFFPKLSVLELVPVVPSCLSSLTSFLFNQMGDKNQWTDTVVKIFFNIFEKMSSFKLSGCSSDFSRDVSRLRAELSSKVYLSKNLSEMIEQYDSLCSSFKHLQELQNREFVLSHVSLCQQDCSFGDFLAGNSSQAESVSKGLIGHIVSDLFSSDNNLIDFWQLLSAFILTLSNVPGEAQMIDRLLDYFAQVVAEYNHVISINNQRLFHIENLPDFDDFKSLAGSVHYVCFASMLLHTDLHNQSVQHKMGKDLFTASLEEAIGEHSSIIDCDLFSFLYDSIKNHPIPPVISRVDLFKSKSKTNSLIYMDLNRKFAVAGLHDDRTARLYLVDPRISVVYYESVLVDFLLTCQQSKMIDSYFFLALQRLANLKEIDRNNVCSTVDKICCSFFGKTVASISEVEFVLKELVRFLVDHLDCINDSWPSILKFFNFAQSRQLFLVNDYPVVTEAEEIKFLQSLSKSNSSKIFTTLETKLL
ncbi:hypothetical protein GEMRC1_001517 [Eukaryota sp. GEM-RC1]